VETLRRNRLDSPVRLALRAQWTDDERPAMGAAEAPTPPVAWPSQSSVDAGQPVEVFMKGAEEAIRLHDLELARTNYWAALRLDATNILARMRLGLTLKQQGEHHLALDEFVTVTRLAPDYGEAWKEKGVVEGLIARALPEDTRPKWLQDGCASLARATELLPQDFDAWSALGGVLRNVHSDYAGALRSYRRGAQVSNGHPYPLLNALKLEAQETGSLDLDSVSEQLEAAERIRQGQISAEQPVDTPWCYFDVAEIRLYRGDRSGFLESLEEGIASCNAAWQPSTFSSALKTAFEGSGIELDGLSEGLERLAAAERSLP